MTFGEIMGVIIATAVTIALRWAAHRWPMDGETRKPTKRTRKTEED